MIDKIEGLRIIISGSSSFDIDRNAGELLTGRKIKEFLPTTTFGERINNKKSIGWKKGPVAFMGMSLDGS